PGYNSRGLSDLCCRLECARRPLSASISPRPFSTRISTSDPGFLILACRVPFLLRRGSWRTRSQDRRSVDRPWLSSVACTFCQASRPGFSASGACSRILLAFLELFFYEFNGSL